MVSPYATAPAASLDELVGEIERLRRRVRAMARTPQLKYSAIDDGALVTTVGGQLTSIIGRQYDGTTGAVTVAGPTPPTPAAPTLTATIGGVVVRWDGTWADPQPGFTSPVVAPMDFARVEVHVSDSPDFPATGFGTMRGGISSPRGGSVVVPWPTAGTPLYARLVARSTAGKASLPGLTTGPVASGKVDIGSVGFDIGQLGGVKTFYTGVAPTGLTADDRAVWWDSSNGYAAHVWDYAASPPAWKLAPFGNGAIGPNSLVASNVLATGSVTAALLEALLVLATNIAAGDVTGDHARMTPTGFRVYQKDPAGSTTPLEVIRMGTDTNDYFGVVDSTNTLVASIDDTGRASFSGLNVRDDPLFQGMPLSQLLGMRVEQSPGRFAGYPPALIGGGYGPIASRVGIAEVNGYLHAGRDYEVSWIGTGMCDVDDSVETRVYLQVEGPTAAGSDTAAAPNVSTSPEVDHWLHTFHWAGRWETVNAAGRFSCKTTGRHRFLLASERGALGRTGATNAYIYWRSEHKVSLVIKDIGPTSAEAGQFTQAGGTMSGGTAPAPAPTPKQQYYVELSPAGWATYRGNGTLRTDTSDVVQGWDPSGYNGDGKGYWWFNLPSITGTVDRVDIYAYSNFWYFNSGGTAIWNISPVTGTATPNFQKLRADWFVAGYPKPGPVTVTVPSDWNAFFANASSPRAVAVTLGPSGGTNETYYGRFNGGATRLRIWYTQ